MADACAAVVARQAPYRGGGKSGEDNSFRSGGAFCGAATRNCQFLPPQRAATNYGDDDGASAATSVKCRIFNREPHVLFGAPHLRVAIGFVYARFVAACHRPPFAISFPSSFLANYSVADGTCHRSSSCHRFRWPCHAVSRHL